MNYPNEYCEVLLTVGEGPVGINLQSVKNGAGAFIESFYRTNDDALLAAERCGELTVGDRIAYINDEYILDLNIDSIKIKLSKVERPLKILFWRYANKFGLVDIISDSRVRVWLDLYLMTYCLSSDATLILEKIRIFNSTSVLSGSYDLLSEKSQLRHAALKELKDVCLKSIIFCMEQYPSIVLPLPILDSVRLILTTGQASSLESLLNAVKSVNAFLSADLEKTFLFKYRHCMVAKRMVGWMSSCPKFYLVSIVDILRSKVLLVCFYMFLCHLNRHHTVHLLLYKSLKSRLSKKKDGDNKALVRLQQFIVLETARDDLMTAFYGSPVYEALLSERFMASASSAEGTAETATNIRSVYGLARNSTGVDSGDSGAAAAAAAAAGPCSQQRDLLWNSGCLQRILRAIADPPRGISLHRQQFPRIRLTHTTSTSASATTLGADFVSPLRVVADETHLDQHKSTASCDTGSAIVVTFDTDLEKSINNGNSSTSSPPAILHIERCAALTIPIQEKGEGPSSGNPIVLSSTTAQFLAPVSHIRKESDPENETGGSAMRLYSFVLAEKCGRLLYGASILTHKLVLMPRATEVGSSPAPASGCFELSMNDVAVDRVGAAPALGTQTTTTSRFSAADSISERDAASSVPPHGLTTPTDHWFSPRWHDESFSFAVSGSSVTGGVINRARPTHGYSAYADEPDSKGTSSGSCGDELEYRGAVTGNKAPPTTAATTTTAFLSAAAQGLSWQDAKDALFRHVLPRSSEEHVVAPPVTISSNGNHNEYSSIPPTTTTAMSKLKEEAGEFLRSFSRQWGEHQQQKSDAADTKECVTSPVFVDIGVGVDTESLEALTFSAGSNSNSGYICDQQIGGITINNDVDIALSAPDTAPPSLLVDHGIPNRLSTSPQVTSSSLGLRVRVPYGIGIISTVPAVDALRNPLRDIAPFLYSDICFDGSASLLERVQSYWKEHDSLAALATIANQTVTTSLPLPAAADFDPAPIYEALSPQSLVKLYLACVLEYKVLLVSSNRHTVALLLGEWLKQAIAPMQWCHIYAPVVPQRLALELLHCPAPYILGIQRSSLLASAATSAQLRDVLVVDLDNNTTQAPPELDSALPVGWKLVCSLSSRLQPHLSTCDYVHFGSTAANLSYTPVTLCHRFLEKVLRSLDKCFVVLEEECELVVALDEELFFHYVDIGVAPAADSLVGHTSANATASLHQEYKRAEADFLRQLVRTQCFSEHLLSLARAALLLEEG